MVLVLVGAVLGLLGDVVVQVAQQQQLVQSGGWVCGRAVGCRSGQEQAVASPRGLFLVVVQQQQRTGRGCVPRARDPRCEGLG